jgi:hypothetical protein
LSNPKARRQWAAQLNPCIHGFEVGVNCAATAAFIAHAGKISAQGVMSLPQRRLLWPCRSSSPQRWLARETAQQPVFLFRPKSANVFEISAVIVFFSIIPLLINLGKQ